MVTDRLQDAELFAGHSPDQERPLGSYAALTGVFLTLTAAFLAWIRASGRELPERVGPGDLALITVATHKASRLIAKDRVTSAVRAPFTRFEGDAGPGEVDEKARGRGLRRALRAEFRRNDHARSREEGEGWQVGEGREGRGDY